MYAWSNGDVEIIASDIDQESLIMDLTWIIERYGFEGYKQISLQSHIENADPRKEYLTGTGKVRDLPAKEEEFVHPLFPDGTINKYIKKFGMYRARIMKLPVKMCMSIHKDRTPRVHIPIVTNSECRMMIHDQTYHLKPGLAYWTDTTKKHTAFNGGTYPRIHLVGCVKS